MASSKTVICLLFVFVTVYALTDEQTEKLNKVSRECREKSGLTEEMVQKIRNGEYHDDPKVKEQVLCVSKKFGMMKEDGEIDVDVLKAKMKKVAENDEEVDKVVEKCAVKKDTPEETAFEVMKCLRANKPKFSPAH